MQKMATKKKVTKKKVVKKATKKKVAKKATKKKVAKKKVVKKATKKKAAKKSTPKKKSANVSKVDVVAAEVVESSPFLDREDIIVITDADAENVDPSQPTLFIDVEIIDNDNDEEPEVKTSVFEAYLEEEEEGDNDEVVVESKPLFTSSDDDEPNRETYISEDAEKLFRNED